MMIKSLNEVSQDEVGWALRPPKLLPSSGTSSSRGHRKWDQCPFTQQALGCLVLGLPLTSRQCLGGRHLNAAFSCELSGAPQGLLTSDLGILVHLWASCFYFREIGIYFTASHC